MPKTSNRPAAQADLIFRDAGTCPSCGGSLTRDPDARISQTCINRYPLRHELPFVVWVPCVIDYCTICGWTQEISRGGLR